MPWFQGSYLFGDYSSDESGPSVTRARVVTDFTNRSFELDPPGDLAIEHVSSFGEDGVGELYVIDRMGGEIYRIIGGCQGESYCESEINSSGSSAVIAYSGSTSLAANNMVLHASQCPPRQPGIFFYGPAQLDVPFGNGHLCVGSGVVGLFQLRPPQHPFPHGRTGRPLDFTAPRWCRGRPDHEWVDLELPVLVPRSSRGRRRIQYDERAFGPVLSVAARSRQSLERPRLDLEGWSIPRRPQTC
jgi:hypothetical protein